MDLSRNFSCSTLIRLLSDMTPLDVEGSQQDVAERLSLWLNAADSVTLHAALQPSTMPAQDRPSDARAVGAVALEEEFHRVRTDLVRAIMANDMFGAGGHRAQALRQAEVADDADAGYAIYYKRYLDHQRHMNLKMTPLRAHVRQVLAKTSPKLRQLATLDAVMEQTLGGREQKLLAVVPLLLERRFEHWKPPHQEVPDALKKQRNPSLWLDAFCKELQDVLLAELDVRLQPVVGLIEAFSNEVKNFQ